MKGKRIIDIAENRFQLRSAAGRYWLLDMEQEGLSYQKPILINETGAKVWSLWEMGKTQDEIVILLSESYDITKEELEKDVEAFFEMLESHL